MDVRLLAPVCVCVCVCVCIHVCVCVCESKYPAGQVLTRDALCWQGLVA